MSINLKISVLITVFVINMQCSNSGTNITFFYKPPVYFAGYINNTYDSLTGNSSFQNSCKLVKDTVRMYLYSESFSEESNVRDGDFMRMDIYPGSDSALGRRKVLFHMARYHGGNASYNIDPSDTLLGEDKIQFKTNVIDRRRDGTVDLQDFTVSAQVMSSTTGKELEIIRGRIKGTIE
jgi:hypothetical protein